MVKEISIGIIGIQGAISEHLFSMRKALQEKNILGKAFVIRDKKEINEIDALILPGGESTTISRILYESGFYDAILKRLKDNDLPIMGTCAGCVILSSETADTKNDVKLLSAMNMRVNRNAFGDQTH